LLQGLGSNEKFTYEFSTIPERIVTGDNRPIPGRLMIEPITGQAVKTPGVPSTPISAYLTLITSMFMHGGIAHIFGNMLFLFIFGDNIEDRLGHLRYLIFYLVCGVLAGLSHVFATALFASDASSLLVPSLGASGAIAAVLGGYIVLYPRARILSLVFIVFFVTIVEVPAVLLLGFWFLEQIYFGAADLSNPLGGGGGVAYFAHVGGFLFGLALIGVFAVRRSAQPPRYPVY